MVQVSRQVYYKEQGSTLIVITTKSAHSIKRYTQE